MSILLTLAAAAGAILYWLWRLDAGVSSAKRLSGAAGDAGAFFRKRRWQNRGRRDPLEGVDDPRLAATALMTALAQADGALTDAERKAVLEQMKRHFSFPDTGPEDLFAEARFLVAELDAWPVFVSVKPLIEKTCDEARRRELVAMLLAVAAADPAGGGEVRAVIARIAESLALR
jgi:uncharacterized tellurite resistance protein B-like protein